MQSDPNRKVIKVETKPIKASSLSEVDWAILRAEIEPDQPIRAQMIDLQNRYQAHREEIIPYPIKVNFAFILDTKPEEIMFWLGASQFQENKKTFNEIYDLVKKIMEFLREHILNTIQSSCSKLVGEGLSYAHKELTGDRSAIKDTKKFMAALSKREQAQRLRQKSYRGGSESKVPSQKREAILKLAQELHSVWEQAKKDYKKTPSDLKHPAVFKNSKREEYRKLPVDLVSQIEVRRPSELALMHSAQEYGATVKLPTLLDWCKKHNISFSDRTDTNGRKASKGQTTTNRRRE